MLRTDKELFDKDSFGRRRDQTRTGGKRESDGGNRRGAFAVRLVWQLTQEF